MSSVIRLSGVTRAYGHPPVTALGGVSIEVDSGEYVAIVGASGSGKSTLLNVMGTLDRPSAGTVELVGIDTTTLTDVELSALRSQHIGFVFQQFHLREGVSAEENVADGLLYSGVPRRERMQRAQTILSRVGLGERMHHKPHQMSGGERQRVAIARAVVGDPPILLADEPTGNLDSRASASIIELLDQLHQAGTSIVIITHDPKIAAKLPRQITISDGAVTSDSRTQVAA